VVVIGGGDTGSDCIGICNRQGAASVVNLQYTPQPPAERPLHQPWPFWPMRMRTSSSHEEGCDRRWGLLTKRFVGRNGYVTALVTVEVDVETRPDGVRRMVERPGSEREWPADLVLLAIGFSGPEKSTLIADYGLLTTPRGNLATDRQYMTGVPGLFAAGDARRGQSLIVWAISEGREAARAVDLYLMGESELPGKGCCDL
jgi:glutamate synthase (NADPH/NADH) small chain